MRSFRLIGCVALTLLLVSSSGRAQRGLPIDRLPADTYAFMVWHGQAAIAKGPATNTLVRLWNDPEFQSIRKALTERLTGSAPASTADREAIADVLLSPAIVGLAGRFDLARLGAADKADDIGSDFFLIADATGREAQWQRIDAMIAKEAGGKPTFRGMVGTWRVQAGRQALFDALSARLKASAAPTDAVTQTPLYLAGQRFRAEGAVAEYFLKMPSLAGAKPAAAGSFDLAAFMRGMHLERVQGLVGSVGLAGSGTLVRSALVGDTSAGSLFDLFGTSTTSFGTLLAAPAGYSYSGSKLDLAALYKTVRDAMQSAMPPEQFASVEMMEGMAAAELNMPIADVLGSFDEIGTVTPVDAVSTDLTKTMFALRLKRTKELLALLRTGAADMISNDVNEGDTTYMTLSTPLSTMHVAVTPTLLVAGANRAFVREAVARAAVPAATPPAGSLAADAEFKRRRALFPPALTSLAYSDMSKFPWQTLLSQVEDAVPTTSKPDPSKPAAPEITKALPGLLARYFHSSASASWKVPQGMFFEIRVD